MTPTNSLQNAELLAPFRSRFKISDDLIFLADIWKPRKQWDSRYLWMPLEIGDGKLFVPQPQRWTLNVTTGETTFP